MKYIYCFSLVLYLLLFICSCENISPDAVDITVDYSWGTRPGENRENPEIRLTGVPSKTRFLEVYLVDLDVSFADHGEIEKIPYTGKDFIPSGSLKKYIGPSPPRRNGYAGNLYEFTIKALDENETIIGIGKTAKRCCPHINQKE